MTAWRLGRQAVLCREVLRLRWIEAEPVARGYFMFALLNV
jgi:hypothetical protein